MPQWFWKILLGLIMFFAGPSISTILFSMANEPLYSNYPLISTTLRLCGIIFWIGDWAGLVALIVIAIKKMGNSR
jgi:hypothetical protein